MRLGNAKGAPEGAPLAALVLWSEFRSLGRFDHNRHLGGIDHRDVLLDPEQDALSGRCVHDTGPAERIGRDGPTCGVVLDDPINSVVHDRGRQSGLLVEVSRKEVIEQSGALHSALEADESADLLGCGLGRLASAGAARLAVDANHVLGHGDLSGRGASSALGQSLTDRCRSLVTKLLRNLVQMLRSAVVRSLASLGLLCPLNLVPCL